MFPLDVLTFAAADAALTDLAWWETWLRTIIPYAGYGLAALLPMVVLMCTAFVRIHVVLVLLRQGLGVAQVPGNQVLLVLSGLLTMVVMQPIGTQVYQRGLAPYVAREITIDQAWAQVATPLKQFMVDQIAATRHEHYLLELYDATRPPATSSVPPASAPEYLDQLPFSLIMTAFLISELTTACWIGFTVALPFLVIDLVVASTLSAMGLFLVPPAQIAMPIKLAIFALAEGWWLVADMLMRSFALGATPSG